ncbi:MAG: transporter substrate-binding domain-containing protein, partial [Pseudomonadota bacterium]|nr:transporter substrate-binding domain-containing protein [Pseudomonadota bacterium]
MISTIILPRLGCRPLSLCRVAPEPFGMVSLLATGAFMQSFSTNSFRRCIPAGISALGLALVCVAGTAQAQTINAGSITNSPPMIAYASDGTTLQGVIVDLAAAMSKQMGRSIEFKPMAFAALLPAMQAKNIDVAFSLMNDTAERQKVV